MNEFEELQRLARKHPETVAEMAIRGPAIKLYKWITTRDMVTSRDVVDRFGISIQSASSRLDKLYQRGYLMRTESEQQSGGLEYIYRKI